MLMVSRLIQRYEEEHALVWDRERNKLDVLCWKHGLDLAWYYSVKNTE